MSKKNKLIMFFIILIAFISFNVFSQETDVENNLEKAAKLTGDIIFSVPSSTFQNSVTISLSSKIANAQIRYTTNGRIPTASSSLYNSPLTFRSTTQLRAQSFVNGSLTGEMGSAVYIACSTNIRHDLPLVIIDGYGAGKPGREYEDMAIAIMEMNGQESSLLQTPAVITRGAYHLRGQSSANFEKAPYRLELRDNEDDDAKYDLFGMGKDGDWVLKGPFADKSLIRTAFSFTTGKEIGLQAPDFQFVEVYINQDNGFVDQDDYEGVYLLAETIERSKQRIDIANLKPEDLTEPEITGGYIMQFNMSAAEEPLVRGSGWSDLEVKDPDDLLPEQLNWISNYIQLVQDSIHSSNPSNPNTGYPAFIDVDSFADYIIHNEIGKQPDSYIRSTYIYKDKDDKLKAGPLWDYNLAYDCFTGFGWGTSSNIEGWQYSGGMGFGGVCDWYDTLMKNSDFSNRVKTRWQEWRSGPLSNQEILDRIDSLANPIQNAAHRNFQRWPNLNTKTVGNFGTQTTNTWEEQVQIVKDFIIDRSEWIDQSWGTALPYTMTPTPPPTSTPGPMADLGDVNTDGAINIVDALLIAQYYVNMTPDNFNIDYADVNSDGNVNIVDALLIAQLYVRIIDSFPKA